MTVSQVIAQREGPAGIAEPRGERGVASQSRQRGADLRGLGRGHQPVHLVRRRTRACRPESSAVTTGLAARKASSVASP